MKYVIVEFWNFIYYFGGVFIEVVVVCVVEVVRVV